MRLRAACRIGTFRAAGCSFFNKLGSKRVSKNKLRADQVVRPNAVPRQGVSCGDFWSFSGRSVSKRVLKPAFRATHTLASKECLMG